MRAQAASIVAPIVEASTKTKSSPEKAPLAKDDILRRIFIEMQKKTI